MLCRLARAQSLEHVRDLAAVTNGSSQWAHFPACHTVARRGLTFRDLATSDASTRMRGSTRDLTKAVPFALVPPTRASVCRCVRHAVEQTTPCTASERGCLTTSVPHHAQGIARLGCLFGWCLRL